MKFALVGRVKTRPTRANFLEFGYFGGVHIHKVVIMGCKQGSGPGSSSDRVPKGREKGLLIEPVVGGRAVNGSIGRHCPEFSPVGAPQYVERPAFGNRRPGWALCRSRIELPGAIAGQDENGIDPDAPLHG